MFLDILLPDYLEKVEARSRGGHQMFNGMTFIFFQEIERSVREHFPTNIQNLRDIDIRSFPQGQNHHWQMDPYCSPCRPIRELCSVSTSVSS